jgi:TPR repeat protein
LTRETNAIAHTEFRPAATEAKRRSSTGAHSGGAGNVPAQYSLGLAYEKGKGVPQDYQEAVKWYRIAAAQGYAPAEYSLGVAYEGSWKVRFKALDQLLALVQKMWGR